MIVPCKACGWEDCVCKYVLAKAIVASGIELTQNIAWMCEQIIWEHEREV